MAEKKTTEAVVEKKAPAKKVTKKIPANKNVEFTGTMGAYCGGPNYTKNEWKTNMALGGHALPCPITKEIEELPILSYEKQNGIDFRA